MNFTIVAVEDKLHNVVVSAEAAACMELTSILTREHLSCVHDLDKAHAPFNLDLRKSIWVGDYSLP